ncbi:GRAM domain-containing protein 2A isoform 1-T1 [Lycodopsis pacificus]
MMSENMDQSDDISLLHPHEVEPPREEDGHCPLPFRLTLIDDLSYEDVKKCYRGSTVSKYNSQYHKLFQTVPREEILMKVYSCALLRDILLQGRLYISRNWLCFYANLFGKDIKVCIPVVSVRLVKKHRTAGLVPNGLAITMDTAQKYVFVSLLSRDSVYDVLRRICTHLQVNGKSLSLKLYLEEPISLSMDEFPEVLKWRRKPSLPTVSSSLPDLLGASSPGLAADTPFITHTLTGVESCPAGWPIRGQEPDTWSQSGSRRRRRTCTYIDVPPGGGGEPETDDCSSHQQLDSDSASKPGYHRDVTIVNRHGGQPLTSRGRGHGEVRRPEGRRRAVT